MRHYFFYLFTLAHFIFSQNETQAYQIDSETTYLYDEPGTFEFVTNFPRDYVQIFGQAFKKEYTTNLILIGASTALLIAVDQPLYDETAHLGRLWGIGNEDNTKTMVSVGGFPIFRGPTDFGSAMYFIGDGWTHISLALSFYTAGLIKSDNRALQTASQLAEGMLTTGLMSQVLKHITGRETPAYSRTQDGGIWRFFPNQTDYHNNVPKYDAWPSGHVATATMTLTVISQNYPEYKWIKPVGYGLITLLSFQMVNNGVHWYSDYPLAIGMGYLFGKIAVDNGRRVLKNGVEESQNMSFRIKPFTNSYVTGLNLTVDF